ncbi:putative ribosomal protein L9/RNase H1 [Helianthus annuus]|nr:putative ribosomal protein L9/RNase H1 [Helianthus annuus]
MENLKALRLKEKILLIELKAIRDQIALYDESLETTANSEQESARKQSESIPPQTAKGKEISSPFTPVALEKSKNRVNEELKSSSSPEANGSGKGTSNPLIADSLPKTEKVSLRPSYSQVTQKPENPKNTRFYVIFDGDHRGIYEDWAIVKNYVEKTDYPFKKFGSLLQAQQEATRYSATCGKKEIPLKVTIFSEPLIPKKKERVIEFRNNTFSKPTKIEEKEEKDIISLDEFRAIWSKARAISQDDFEFEHIYTEVKATKSLIIFCPGANPELVSLAFSAGLAKFIYPSPNLLEISNLYEGMKKAIKNFRKKIAAARDANIFIKCTSTLPDWYQGKTFPSYHHLEIGIAKARTVNPSRVIKEDYEDYEKWLHIRTKGFLQILENLQKIKVGSFNKVNYCSTNCIITSYSGTPLPLHEKEALERMEQRIIFNKVEAGPATKEQLCQKLQRTFENHQCEYCKASSSEENKNPTEKDSYFSDEDTRELDPTHGYID